MEFNREKHWENIYTSKETQNCSWYQEQPINAIEFIKRANLNSQSKIIDVGGGDGFLVDYLLKQGFTNITVLDISQVAINKAKFRVEKEADNVNWVVSDILNYSTNEKYDFWYDRAVFHFLTDPSEVKRYVELTNRLTSEYAEVVIGTFSKSGPIKCSGIEIQQYDENSLKQTFSPFFKCSSVAQQSHETPFNTTQDFIFCSFHK